MDRSDSLLSVEDNSTEFHHSQKRSSSLEVEDKTEGEREREREVGASSRSILQALLDIRFGL